MHLPFSFPALSIADWIRLFSLWLADLFLAETVKITWKKQMHTKFFITIKSLYNALSWIRRLLCIHITCLDYYILGDIFVLVWDELCIYCIWHSCTLHRLHINLKLIHINLKLNYLQGSFSLAYKIWFLL